MTDDSATYDVVEARLDGALIAEAALPGDDDGVPTGADSTAVDEPILGATPAETPPDDVDVESSEETPYEKFERLLNEGYKRSQLTAITDAKGTLRDVRLG